MPDPTQFTNRCACGWEVTGPEDVVVDATIDHGWRIHNMEATRDQVLAVLRAGGIAGADQSGDDAGDAGAAGTQRSTDAEAAAR